MRNRFRHAVPVAVIGIIALCFLAGCEECPDFDKEETGDCTLTGYVLDAMTGYGVANALVEAGSANGTTNESGWFFVRNTPCGEVVVEISADGYIPLETVVAISDTTEQDFALVPESEFDDWRFILSWGEHPADLDSHLWVPSGDGYWHVYYANSGSLVGPPYAQLDVDDVTSYGPETITVRKHGVDNRTEDFYPGEYVYAVRHYSGQLSIPESGAQVRIYRGNTLVRTINAPQGTASTGWYWYVGRLNCNTGAWTLVNTYSSSMPVMLAGEVEVAK
ncbi:MAG: carboxypeptidase regulatory-like domain-containing protein [Candidatus Eisenbacteria bacterium]|nr:carboxypeptidase regulatory-like domain-containing protein [Candidatus Eisenbacteria bacterium]